MRVASVSRRHVATSLSPSKAPSLTLVLPTSMARTMSPTAASLDGGDDLRLVLCAALDEPRVQRRVWRELRVECRREQIALAGGGRAGGGRGRERLCLGSNPLDQRRTDEDRVQWVVEA